MKAERNQSAPVPPTQPRDLKARIQEEGDTLAINVPDGHWGTGFFLGIWLTGWSVGCVALAWMVLTQRQPFMLLFATPFWLSWFFVAALVLDNFLGRQRFALSPTGLVVEWCVISLLSRRELPLEEIRNFQVKLFNVDSEGSSTTGIEVVTLGRSLTFGTDLPALERSWLAHRLNEHLRHVRTLAGVGEWVDGDVPDCRDCQNPSDSTWRQMEEFNQVTFEQRGKFSLGSILGLVFINGFWNGIVGVFVAVLFGMAPGDPGPKGLEWWGLCAFLIPFEVIGLAMFAGLVLAVLEPFRVTRWSFGADGIEQVTTRLGLPLGTRRGYACDRIESAAIRDDLVADSWGIRRLFASNQIAGSQQPTTPTGEQFGLLLTSPDHREICSITGLTLGEARWMKGRLQEAGRVEVGETVLLNTSANPLDLESSA